MSIQEISLMGDLARDVPGLLSGGVFPQLTLRELIYCKRTCAVFCQIISQNPHLNNQLSYHGNLSRYLSDRLDAHPNIEEWAVKQPLLTNFRFYSPVDARSRRDCAEEHHNSFSLHTLCRVASWLKDVGDTPIPPCRMHVHQPRALTPMAYVDGILQDPWESPDLLDPARIFVHLSNIAQCDKKLSSNCQKASAIRLYVLERFLADNLSNVQELSSEGQKVKALELYILGDFLDRPLS